MYCFYSFITIFLQYPLFQLPPSLRHVDSVDMGGHVQFSNTAIDFIVQPRL